MHLLPLPVWTHGHEHGHRHAFCITLDECAYLDRGRAVDETQQAQLDPRRFDEMTLIEGD